MHRINPRLLGVLVVLGGVCAALPFQNLTTRRAHRKPSSNSTGIQWRSNDFTLEVTSRAEPLTGTPAADERPESPAFGRAGGPVASAHASLDNAAQPPALADDYQTSDGPDAPGASGNAFSGAAPEAAAAARPSVPRPAAPSLPVSVSIAHEIADGDTLEDLAEQYLGSRLRWTEIYNANPEILNDPEVLPIGVTIVILPGRRRPVATDSDVSGDLVPISRNDLQKFRDPQRP